MNKDIKAGKFSNGKREFQIEIIDDNKVSIYSETGVPILKLKPRGTGIIGKNDLNSFMNDELNDYELKD